MQSLKTLDDEELIQSIQAGKEIDLYWKEITSRYYFKIVSRCKEYLKNDEAAEDVAHEIIIHVLIKLSTFRHKSKFSTWLYTIVNNRCIDHLRKTKGKIYTVLDQEVEDQIEDIAEENLQDLDFVALEDALLLLKPREREMLEKKFVEKMSIKKMAEFYSCSEGSIKMSLLRVKKKLKGMLR